MGDSKPEKVVLSDIEREALTRLVRRRKSSQQLALRARVVLAAAAGLNHTQIARELGVSLEMARLWRRRWLELQTVALDELSVLQRLADAPRPGAPVRKSAKPSGDAVALVKHLLIARRPFPSRAVRLIAMNH